MDRMRSPIQLSKSFYLCPEEGKSYLGSLNHSGDGRQTGGLEVWMFLHLLVPYSLFKKFERLCAILFRNEEARAALLKCRMDLTQA